MHCHYRAGNPYICDPVCPVRQIKMRQKINKHNHVLCLMTLEYMKKHGPTYKLKYKIKKRPIINACILKQCQYNIQCITLK